SRSGCSTSRSPPWTPRPRRSWRASSPPRSRAAARSSIRRTRKRASPAGSWIWMRPMLDSVRCIVHRDLLLALRRRSDVATALLFFVIVASLFPLGIGAEPNLLRAIAPGVIWVAALLSSMLSLGSLFAADHADGTLEQMLLGAAPLGVVAAAKAFTHW